MHRLVKKMPKQAGEVLSSTRSSDLLPQQDNTHAVPDAVAKAAIRNYIRWKAPPRVRTPCTTVQG